MAKITVKAKIDAGIHIKYGPILAGKTYEIDEEDFGDQLFERPHPGFESPYEKADRERREALEKTAAEPAPAFDEAPPATPQEKPKKGGQAAEVKEG